MKTKLIKHGLVAFHWLTMAGVIAQECWSNRYAHNLLVMGLLFWIILGALFCTVALGYALGSYTPNLISAAISLTKPLEPAWWRLLLKLVHCFVLFFAMMTGHWWCAVIFGWLWGAAKIANLTAKAYLADVKVEGTKATVSGLARN